MNAVFKYFSPPAEKDLGLLAHIDGMHSAHYRQFKVHPLRNMAIRTSQIRICATHKFNSINNSDYVQEKQPGHVFGICQGGRFLSYARYTLWTIYEDLQYKTHTAVEVILILDLVFVILYLKTSNRHCYFFEDAQVLSWQKIEIEE